jgi:hypothetical protein
VVTVTVFTAVTVTAFLAATAVAVAAFAATFIAATATAVFTATLATALMSYQVATAIFKDETVRATGNRNRSTVAAVQFIAGRAGWRRRRNTFATNQFIVSRAARRRNDTTVPTHEDITGRAFRTILVVARTATATFAIAAARQCERSAGPDHEKPNREKCRQTLLHERSFARGLSLVMAMAGLAAMLWLVVVASFASPAAFSTAGTVAFTALIFAAVTFVTATSFALFAAAGFTALAAMNFAFVRLFARAFVLKMTAFTVDARWWLWFFTGAFVGNTGAFTVNARWWFWFFTGAFIGNARAFTLHARRFVLVKACATRHLACAAAGKRERAASAKHEESNCRKCGEAAPHRRPFLPGGARTSGGAHRAQLYSI